MVMRLVRRNTKNVPWITEETLVPVRRESSIDRVIGLRMSKSSSPSEVSDSRILRAIVGPKDLGAPAHFE